MKRVAVLGTFNTKAEELLFLKDEIEKAGLQVLLIDFSLTSSGEKVKVDITKEEVAKAAGQEFEKVSSLSEWEASVVMAEGLSKKIQELYSKGEICGAIAVGGSMGTFIASEGMKALPFGVPKVIVSTVPSLPPLRYIGGKDVVMYYSPVDFWGLNWAVKTVLRHAAGALIGMVTNRADENLKKAIGITTLGTAAHTYVLRVKEKLKEKGYELIVFHTTGSGGQALEEMLENELLKGALDLSLFEITNEVLGGIYSAGPKRLRAKTKVPRVVAPGAIDLIGFGSPGTIPEKFKERKIRAHNPAASVAKISKEEARIVAEEVIRRLEQAKGQVKVLIPLKGFSNFSKEGTELYNPEVDLEIVDMLKKAENLDIEILDYHINDSKFIDYALETLFKFIEK